MVADVDKVETVPVLLDFPDEVLIRGEFSRKALRGRFGNFLAPQIISNQVEKISHPERNRSDIRCAAQGQEITPVEFHVGKFSIGTREAAKMRNLRRRGELFPLLVRDAGIGGDVAHREAGRIQVREEAKQVFSNPQVSNPGRHTCIIKPSLGSLGIPVMDTSFLKGSRV